MNYDFSFIFMNIKQTNSSFNPISTEHPAA